MAMAKKAKTRPHKRLSQTISWNRKQKRCWRHHCGAVREGKAEKNVKWSSMHNTSLDICREIFYYLPVKSLIRFRAVSKPWKSIIEEPEFISSYQQHRTTYNNSNDSLNPLLIVKDYSFDWLVICSKTFQKISNIKYPPVKNRWTVTSARDGLLLFQNPIALWKDDATLMLWNPSIQISVYIPPPPILYHNMTRVLGFDQSEDDYKVVTFHYDHIAIPPSFQVFSLKSWSWEEVSYSVVGKFPHRVDHHYWNNASIGEYIHWIGGVCDEDENLDRFTLVSLNLTTRTVLYTPFPDQLDKKCNPVLVNQHSCSIGLLTLSGVWVLEGLHNAAAAGLHPRWKKMYEPELKLDAGLLRNYMYLTKDDLLLSSGFNKLDVRNLKTGEEKKFPYSGIIQPIFINAYIESLVLFNWR